jgi:oxygen-independent coproporphyrinogen-3 oxidase
MYYIVHTLYCVKPKLPTNLMAGIYLHIPFCKQACYYCDFHFSTNTEFKAELVQAMAKEIAMQAHYLGENPTLETIYFGGGTPSLLSESELGLLMEMIYKHFNVSTPPEISLEANPDDLSLEKIKQLQNAGINRLSIGIQSFDDNNLAYLHRAHNAVQASNCVKLSQDLGISNISIDLIYAIPSEQGEDHADEIWQGNLAKALDLDVPHISSYCLTIEPQTAFGKWLEKGKIAPIDEDRAARHFEMLVAELTDFGYEHYEVSNFAKPQHYSRHNTNYWRQIPYLGIGPSAHSFDLHSRQYNVSNNAKYMAAIQANEIPCEREELQNKDRINEYILTTLRTQWGCDLGFVKEHLNFDIAQTYAKELAQWTKAQWANVEDNHLILTTQGKLLADGLVAKLFV